MALPAGVNTTEELMQVMKMYKVGGGNRRMGRPGLAIEGAFSAVRN